MAGSVISFPILRTRPPADRLARTMPNLERMLAASIQRGGDEFDLATYCAVIEGRNLPGGNND